MTSRVLLSLIATALGFVALPSAKADPRAVVELFTSQGCSSCPAADRLLSELQSDPAFLTLSLAIDYWDYLGWKDTLAIPNHTLRQRGYSAMRGDREIYTPQAVINGVSQAIGSDRASIESAVAQSYTTAAPLSVPIDVTIAGERVLIKLPTHDEAAGSELWICPITASVSVGIGRGENRGRTNTYTNVVRRWIKVANWDGKGNTFPVPVDAIKFGTVDSFAVILQNGSSAHPGVILGAALTSLTPTSIN